MITNSKNTTVSIRMPNDQLSYLKKMSHYMSIERDSDLNYQDLIREAIEAQFPMPVVQDEN
jgi:predicted DNA binding CopG/RHH family protein